MRVRGGRLHYRRSRNSGGENRHLRNRSNRSTMGVPPTYAPQTQTQRPTSNGPAAYHECHPLYSQRRHSLAPIAEELSTLENCVPCVSSLELGQDLGGSERCPPNLRAQRGRAKGSPHRRHPGQPK